MGIEGITFGGGTLPPVRRQPAAVGSLPAAPQTPAPVRPVVAALLRMAAARPEMAWPPGATLAAARNAHYANTAQQVAIALAGDYNSVEGDVRVVGGIPVMAHDKGAPHELTFAEWAEIVGRSGKMLRIDIKEAAALNDVLATLRRLGIPHERITLNVAVYAPWSAANISIDRARAVRAALPGAWLTFNVPAPVRLGYDLAASAGEAVGGKVGLAIVAPLATRELVERLTIRGMMVNIWNPPQVWQPDNIAAETARLRSIGVNGMIDLRRRDDPLAND